MAQWTVSTHYKKSCQEVENWVQSNGDGRITVVNGFRYGEWIVYTTDDNMPEFEFVEVPGGDGKKDSINLLDCEVNNIESVELVEMYDGGCWYDVEVQGLDEEAEEEIRDFIDENRDESPLRKAEDALLLDNGKMSKDEQLAWILAKIK